jgi:hypothetical protein
MSAMQVNSKAIASVAMFSPAICVAHGAMQAAVGLPYPKRQGCQSARYWRNLLATSALRGIEVAMSVTLTMPALAVVHEGSRRWAVRATWPDGRVDGASGFESEQQANDCKFYHFRDWLADLEKARGS